MRRLISRILALGVACVGLLLAAAPVFGQGGFGGTPGGMGGSPGATPGGASSGGNFIGGTGSGSGGNFIGGTGSGSGGNFIGGTGSMTGGSFTGGTPGTGNTPGAGGRGAANTTPGASSFLGAYYANPIAMGYGMGTGSATGGTVATANTKFGTAMFNLTQSNQAGTASAATSNTGMQGLGAGYNIRRLPAYAATIKIKDMPPPPTARQVRTDLQGMLATSPGLDRRDSVRVVIDGPAVVLQGRVPDDDERLLIENMVRLTPGVDQVRNELTTMTATTAARSP